MAVATHRFEALDGLRGLFAVLVAFYHFKVVWSLHGSALVNAGFLAVDFFFVLSGFVISHATAGKLNGPREAGIFALRRFGRLWPLHAAVLAAMVALMLLKLLLVHGGTATNNIPFAPHGETPLLGIPANLALVQSLNLFKVDTWNGPSWSISCEFYTYLLFALVMLSFGRRAVWLAPLLVAASAVFLFGTASTMDISYDDGLIRCVYGFFTGHLVYRLWQARPLRGLPHATAAELACAALMVAYPLLSYDNRASLLAPLVFALPLWVFAHQGGLLSRGLQSRALQTLGALSYAIYMVHYPLFVFASQAVTVAEKLTHRSFHVLESLPGRAEPHRIIFAGNMALMDAAVLALLAATIGLAALAVRFVEAPGRAAFNRLAGKLAPSPQPLMVMASLPPNRAESARILKKGGTPMALFGPDPDQAAKRAAEEAEQKKRELEDAEREKASAKEALQKEIDSQARELERLRTEIVALEYEITNKKNLLSTL
jgi:peptidoglycan/LPS O-acetylase OafA/YrhL